MTNLESNGAFSTEDVAHSSKVVVHNLQSDTFYLISDTQHHDTFWIFGNLTSQHWQTLAYTNINMQMVFR